MEQSTKSFTGTIIGVDFSINKPACCILHNNEYLFISWPYNVPEKITESLSHAGVTIIKRTDNKDKGEGTSAQMRYEVENSAYMANLIRESLLPYLNSTPYLAFEGLSYGSPGDVGIQLGGYKYMLMHYLSEYIPLSNMYTYTPITIKSTAGCAKRGMGKVDMINAFIKNGPPHCKLRIALFEHPERYQSPKAKNWVIHLDDIIDAYYTLETLRKKENL